MRYTILLLFILGCSSPKQQQNAQIVFPETALDLGVLEYKKPAMAEFEIENPGETPLVILNVKSSCGCTVPEWDKKPIKKDKKGRISVSYDAEFPGRFRKSLVVFYNGVNSPDTLIIKGEVEYPEELSGK